MKILNFHEMYPIQFAEMDRITLELVYEQKALREFEFYKPFRDLFEGGEKA